MTDFYSSQQECMAASSRRKEQTNPRYKQFNQTHFTAGDEEQFQQYRDATNGSVCKPDIPLADNKFSDVSIPTWSKYKDLQATAVINTFRYIFNKFKKGIFVKIVDNKVRVFLPFSKANFTNEWSHKIRVDNRYKTINDFLHYIADLSGYRFNPRSVNSNIDEWYGNNCLIRYDFSEGDSNVGNVKNMLEVMCQKRVIPDIEFFINRRDFPLLTRDATEPYNNIWDGIDIPLQSHNYPKYCPILSMSTSDRYADLAMPTWDDWARVQSHDNVWFPKSCSNYNHDFDSDWDNKIPMAVFRGGTTGCGVTIDTNPRLKLVAISMGNKDYLDAGITNWNLRPRKLQGKDYLETINIKSLPFQLSPKLTPVEQSKYKYIVNVDGHVSAFRLSLELNMGSVILLVKSSWKLWYSDMLIEYIHYVPVREDMSNLIDQIKWCRSHDAECQEIVVQARAFFSKYLQKDGILDYMQRILVGLKQEMGVYLYNIQTPLDTQINNEYKALNHPGTHHSWIGTQRETNISVIPRMTRCYGLLAGIQYIINMVITDGTWDKYAKNIRPITQNKLGVVTYATIADFPLAIKSTKDSSKIKEHIHEAYIGTKAINELLNYIPNFAYIFGLYENKDMNEFNVVTEFIEGITLADYIKSIQFNFEEFLFIIIQLCLALQVAQNHCALVHYDLAPWNIMIQRSPTPITFDYIIEHNKIFRVNTTVIPVIIDYGKSHVVYDQEHHGFINMFNVSTAQDIISLLITCMDKVTTDQRQLSPGDFNNLLKLANFLTGTGYRRQAFTNAKDLRDFLHTARKYSTLITQDKHELELKTPLDLFNYIWSFSGYSKLHSMIIPNSSQPYQNIMNNGNARQVFEYILSKTTAERLDTYMAVFRRIKHCSIPQPDNLFFIYYAAQSLEANILSVKNDMRFFLLQTKTNPEPYIKTFESTMRFFAKVYQTKIDSMEEQDIEYTIDDDSISLEKATYNSETFLDIGKIKECIMGYSSPGGTDLSDYKEIIQLILLRTNTNYALSTKNRAYYTKNFAKLLALNTLNMHTNIANAKTLFSLSRQIYAKDYEYVTKSCIYAEKYIEILDLLKMKRYMEI